MHFRSVYHSKLQYPRVRAPRYTIMTFLTSAFMVRDEATPGRPPRVISIQSLCIKVWYDHSRRPIAVLGAQVCRKALHIHRRRVVWERCQGPTCTSLDTTGFRRHSPDFRLLGELHVLLSGGGSSNPFGRCSFPARPYRFTHLVPQFFYTSKRYRPPQPPPWLTAGEEN